MTKQQSEKSGNGSQPRLHQELEAAKLLISQLKIIDEDGDPELLADMIEGSTNLTEAVDATLSTIGEDLAMAEALKAQEAQLKARRERFERRAQQKKFAIQNAMTLIGNPKMERPLCTIGKRKGGQSAEIVEEYEIPGCYWEPSEPTLNKKLLLADLKAAKEAGIEIPGAKLVTGEDTFSFRWK